MGSHGSYGKLGETERSKTEFPFQGREVEFSHEDMVGPHSVTDEIENILGLGGKYAQGNQQDADKGDYLFHTLQI